jgi:hypothetical protein
MGRRGRGVGSVGVWLCNWDEVTASLESSAV